MSRWVCTRPGPDSRFRLEHGPWKAGLLFLPSSVCPFPIPTSSLSLPSFPILFPFLPAAKDKICRYCTHRFQKLSLISCRHLSFTKSWNKKVTEGECRDHVGLTVLRPVISSKSREPWWKQPQTCQQTSVPGTKVIKSNVLRMCVQLASLPSQKSPHP